MKIMKNKKETNKMLVYGVFWFAVALVIFVLSHQTIERSYQTSSGVVNAVNQTVNKVVEWNYWTALRRFIWNNHRKMAHIFLYFLMGVLGSLTMKGIKKGLYAGIGLSVIINALYAITDELHQMLVPGRSAELVDWIVDIIGILCGAVLIGVLCEMKKQNKGNKHHE